VLCHSKEHAVRIQQDLARWLAPRGLAFNDDKTRIVHRDQGYDFLGFTIRRFHGKLLIKPSAQAIKRLRTKLRDTVRACYGANAATLIKALVPIVRGWAAYVRSQVATEAFFPAGYQPVEADLSMGHALPSEQAETLGGRPVLRQVRHVQDRPMGLR
jgi:RNA-directed DNA polymerase